LFYFYYTINKIILYKLAATVTFEDLITEMGKIARYARKKKERE
jgi:hypothetical protein